MEKINKYEEDKGQELLQNGILSIIWLIPEKNMIFKLRYKINLSIIKN